MGKKLTQEEVDRGLAERGFTMVDKPYVNSRHRHTYRCSEGHEWKAKFDAVRNSKTGCPTCSDNARKLDISKVEASLAARGITLVNGYRNAISTDTQFSCICGYKWSTTLNSVLNAGSGCKICADNKQKLTVQEINNRLRIRDIKMVGEYINANTKTTFLCKEGHEWAAVPGAILTGNNCPHCKYRDLENTVVYVMHSITHGTKIGISNNVGRRLSRIKLDSNIANLRVVGEFDVGGYKESVELEKLAHEYFKDSTCGYKGFDGATEFFNINPENAIKFIKEQIDGSK